MSALVEQTLAELTSSDFLTADDAVLRCVEFFEHARGNSNVAGPEVTADPASPAELDALRDALVGVVGTAPRSGPTHVAPALFALGKHPDPALVQFFVQWLVEHWRENPHATHQALIGLNNFGEPTLSLEGRLSSNDPDLTLRQAEHYLRSLKLI